MRGRLLKTGQELTATIDQPSADQDLAHYRAGGQHADLIGRHDRVGVLLVGRPRQSHGHLLGQSRRAGVEIEDRADRARMGINGQFEELVAQHAPPPAEATSSAIGSGGGGALRKRPKRRGAGLHGRLAASGNYADKAQRRDLRHDRLPPRLFAGTQNGAGNIGQAVEAGHVHAHAARKAQGIGHHDAELADGCRLNDLGFPVRSGL